MGVKVPIGSYKYNSSRPRAYIVIGGVLQGLSFFFGYCALMALIIAIGYGDIVPWLFVLGFIIFTILCQKVGRRLAIGNQPKVNNKHD